jgi:hypothetical protein
MNPIIETLEWMQSFSYSRKIVSIKAYRLKIKFFLKTTVKTNRENSKNDNFNQIY